MATLSNSEREFLEHHQIPVSRVFNGAGLSRSTIQSEMERLEFGYYYGGATCNRGHQLRNKSGHCIQCDTRRIAFQNRSSKGGYLYIAQSPSKKLIKIGSSQSDPLIRIGHLNNLRYGQLIDLRIQRSIYVPERAGRTEFLIHTRLERHQVKRTYWRDGTEVECRELFNCSIEYAIEIFERTLVEQHPKLQNSKIDH